VLHQGVQGISDLITIPGVVNVDFADVKAIMKDAGSALMGIGKASGENRAIGAAKAAINSPLLERSVNGAKGLLFNVSGGADLSMTEVNEAAQIITETIHPDAKVIFGAVTDESMKKDEIKITVVATGFEENGEDEAMVVKQPGQMMNQINANEMRREVNSGPTQASLAGSFSQPNDDLLEDQQGDQFDIPAFIRRKVK
jgi:cell division protein FtsZ